MYTHLFDAIIEWHYNHSLGMTQSIQVLYGDDGSVFWMEKVDDEND